MPLYWQNAAKSKKLSELGLEWRVYNSWRAEQTYLLVLRNPLLDWAEKVCFASLLGEWKNVCNWILWNYIYGKLFPISQQITEPTKRTSFQNHSTRIKTSLQKRLIENITVNFLPIWCCKCFGFMIGINELNANTMKTRQLTNSYHGTIQTQLCLAWYF